MENKDEIDLQSLGKTGLIVWYTNCPTEVSQRPQIYLLSETMKGIGI